MPDLDTRIRDYLEATTVPIGAREIVMGSTFTEEKQESAPPARGRWLRPALVVAAVAAVLVIGWLLVPGGETDVAPIDSAPEGDAVPSTDVEVVEAALAAFDRGDVGGIASLVESDNDPALGWLLGPAGMVESKAEANGRFVLDEPCRAGNPGFVVCDGTETNDYWGATGLSRPGRLIVEVVGGRIANATFNSEADGDLVGFGTAFLAWWELTYPTVTAGLPTYEGEGPGTSPLSYSTSGLPVAGAMTTALQYVDEFVTSTAGDAGGASAPEVAVLVDVLDAYNAGDIDGYVAVVDGDANEVLGGFLAPSTAEVFLAANSSVEVTDCTAPAPDDPRNVPLGHNAVCSISEWNDFVGPAGLGVQGYVSTIVSPAGSIRLLMVTELPENRTPERFAFGSDFLTWFYETYPEEAAALPPSPIDGDFPISIAETGFPWSGAMPGVLEYVEEFVAQSPDWPARP